MDRFRKLFKEFGVQNGDELEKLLISESYTLPCQGGCNREIPIDDVYFVDGDPFCLICLEEINNGQKVEEDFGYL